MIIVDGKSDKILAAVLKRFYDGKVNRDFKGKINILCLASTNKNKAEAKFSIMLNKKTIVYVIADSDRFHEEHQYNNFITNVKILANHPKTKEVRVIIQNNLEHELSKALAINEKVLFKKFNAESKTEFTSRLGKENEVNIHRKLGELDKTYFWGNHYSTFVKVSGEKLEKDIEFKYESVFQQKGA